MVGSLIVAAITNTAVAAFSWGMTAAAFAINFAVSSIISKSFAPSSSGAEAIDNGVRQQVPPSSTNSIPIVYGDAYCGGRFIDAVLSTDAKTMYYVLVVSHISPNGQFTFDTSDMYWGDRRITFDGTDTTKVVSLTDGAGNVDTQINGNLFIGLYVSSQAGSITSTNGATAPSTFMGGGDIPIGLRWPSTNRQMNGLAFAIVKLNYNRDAETTSMQTVTFKAEHYLNSTGAAKPGDVWYDYMTNELYGAAMASDIVNASSATALNAYSDGLIPYTEGGSAYTQPRYRINGVVDTGQSCLNNINAIMTACDSWNQYNAALGKWSVVINKAETASLAFNDDNIIGEIRVSAFDITSSVNQIEAEFPSKQNRDQSDFVYYETPALLLYPNEPVNKQSIQLSMVNDSVQAQYLASRILEQAREDLIVNISTAYTGIQVDAGDVITVTNSSYGWAAKLFRVMKVSEISLPDGNLGATFELNEYNAQVYDDRDITQYIPTDNSNLPNPGYFSPLPAPSVVASRPDSSIPSFDIEVDIPSTGLVDGITLFYTTTPSVASSWKVLAAAQEANGVPFIPGSTYLFANQFLPAETYYFFYNVSNNMATSATSVVSSSFVWNPVGMVGPAGPAGPTVDISGYASFVQNAGGAYTPASTTLTALVENVTSPTYSWAISGATPTSATTLSVVITPTSSSSGVTVTLTVDGSNLASPIAKTIQMPVVYDGAPGTAGANGVMSAFPSIYIWTGTSTPPTRPSTTSTYTWSTGAYTAPAGWATSAPTNTTPGNYLWVISVPLNVTATTVTSTLDWTDVAYPIRAIAYNGENGASGTSGSATFLVTRTANDSSAPTNAEVVAVIGRNPVAGDIVTVSYNSANNAVVYRYTTSWISQATYITGSLIVSNTITGDKVAANTITGTNIAGTTITAANIAASTITASQIAASTISAANMAANSITAGNAAIADAAVTNAKIADAAITTAKIGNAEITTAKIGTAQVDTLQIAGQAVTIPVSAFTVGSIAAFNNLTTSWKTVQEITFTADGSPIYITTSGSATQGTAVGIGTYNASFRISRAPASGGTPTALTTNSVGNPALNITDSPTPNTYNYFLQILNPYDTSGAGEVTPAISNRSMYALETKR
jgi:hypothetical protein